MAMIDPIADMLTRIRNANQLKYKQSQCLLQKSNKQLLLFY